LITFAAKNMETISDYFCPNEKCKCYGLRGEGNLVKAGTYKNHGIDRQLFKCKICNRAPLKTPQFFHIVF
jgi:hypothetical protein